MELLKEEATDLYHVLPIVLFTEDDWNTTYEGYIIESSIYSHLVRSVGYGTFWIPKENVRLKNGMKRSAALCLFAPCTMLQVTDKLYGANSTKPLLYAGTVNSAET